MQINTFVKCFLFLFDLSLLCKIVKNVEIDNVVIFEIAQLLLQAKYRHNVTVPVHIKITRIQEKVS